MSNDLTPTGNEEIVSASPNPTPLHKKLSRRKVLALAGTGTLVLVVGGGVWYRPHPTIALSTEMKSFADKSSWRGQARLPKYRKSFASFWEQHIDSRYLIQTEALEQNPDVRMWPNAT
jgi:hypothetical protein